MQKALSKLERVDSALAGQALDRVPFSCWYHFGDQHLDGLAHADMEYDFFRHYDLDFLVVMNDREYPRPAVLEHPSSAIYDITEPEHWHQLSAVNPWEYEGYRQVLIAHRELQKRLSGEAHFISSLMSPWSTAHCLAGPVLDRHLREHREDVLTGLEVITVNLERLAAAMIEVGASGIMLSAEGVSGDGVPWQVYRKLARPLDLRILKAAEDAPFNVLHAGGSRIRLSQVADYPVSAFNWSDRDETNPTLRRGHKLTQRTVMGGVDNAAFNETPLIQIRRQVRDALRQTEGHSLIFTPGGSLSSDAAESRICYLREAVKELSAEQDFAN